MVRDERRIAAEYRPMVDRAHEMLDESIGQMLASRGRIIKVAVEVQRYGDKLSTPTLIKTEK